MQRGPRGRGSADARLTHLPPDRESGCPCSGGGRHLHGHLHQRAGYRRQRRQPATDFSQLSLGNPAGRPHDPENQRNVLRAGLKLLEEADRPGVIVDLPYAWSESRAWMEKFMTDEQPFISDDAEAHRQERLRKAREQKARQLP